MGHVKRIALAASCATFALLIAGCGDDGLKGKIADYDAVDVWPKADARGTDPIDQLTTLTPITIKCYEAWKEDANGTGYGDTFKISYDRGSGYIDADTSIMSSKGEVAPNMVPAC